jgi:uncharacterized protein (TIGR03118 family)
MMVRRAFTPLVALGLLAALAFPASARNINAENSYTVHELQTNETDPNLVNGWGITASSTSPWWVSNNGTSTSTLYDGTGAPRPLVVTIPGHPTGTVFNGSSDFQVKVDDVTGLRPSRFLFATDDGHIAGWNGVGTAAIDAAATPDAVYLGLAIANSGGNNYLYAANFAGARVDVFNGTFGTASLSGHFVDPGLPDGYAPFGIQTIGGRIYVAYAKQNEDGDEEVAGEGFGYVDVFDTQGNFIERVASAGELNAPWGLALAPSTFGKFGGDLLVGNFGDGRIHAFTPTDSGWEEHGVLKGTDHRPISIDGLWGIGFGNGAASGPTSTLYFAAGPEDETEGLFGSITASSAP